MAANGANNSVNNTVDGFDHESGTNHKGEPYGYGGNPLAKQNTADSMLPAFGGAFQPGLYRAVKDQNIANPAPLGLSAFALTTFLLSIINLGTRNLSTPNIVVAAAYGYGGLVQLLAGMWEMAVGNTFGATALSSYGGFWISFGIIFTPGGFAIQDAYTTAATSAGEPATAGSEEFMTAFSFYLFGWFIFTFLMLVCTLRSTVAFFFLFLTLDLTFLLLAISYLDREGPMSSPNLALTRAGGAFGILAAFAAWYNALAGILDRGNSFVLVPVAHFPWSEKGRQQRGKPTAAMREAQDAEKTA